MVAMVCKAAGKSRRSFLNIHRDKSSLKRAARGSRGAARRRVGVSGRRISPRWHPGGRAQTPCSGAAQTTECGWMRRGLMWGATGDCARWLGGRQGRRPCARLQARAIAAGPAVVCCCVQGRAGFAKPSSSEEPWRPCRPLRTLSRDLAMQMRTRTRWACRKRCPLACWRPTRRLHPPPAVACRRRHPKHTHHPTGCFSGAFQACPAFCSRGRRTSESISNLRRGSWPLPHTSSTPTRWAGGCLPDSVWLGLAHLHAIQPSPCPPRRRQAPSL